MDRKLPSLKGLRAFEAAARHQSFAKAAGELGVTPAAISQQIRQLEDVLGIALFSRTTRSLALTERARAAVPFLKDGFDGLEAAARELRKDSGKNTVTVSVTSSFGSCWLLPRLESFRRAHPDITVHLDARSGLSDFASDGVDLAIRQGRGSYQGLKSERLISDVALVVCNPALLDGKNVLGSPLEMAGKPLLHVEWQMESAAAPTWLRWIGHHAIDGLDTSPGMRFSMEEFAVRAAIAGMGFALVTKAFVSDDLANGQLARALPRKFDMPTEFHHYVVYPPQPGGQPGKVMKFRDWLFEEVASSSEPW